MNVQYLTMVSEPADEQMRRPRQPHCGVVTQRNHGASIGENMFRFAIQGVLLLAFASTAAASEHYIEIWNPPEARLPQASASGKGIAGKRPPVSRHASRAAPRRVADAVGQSVPGKKRVSDTFKKPITPRPTDIPRIMTPEGNVLRVNYTGSPVQVVR
ncbi:hypothetical protein NDK50_27050 [Paraburkholderia bryophila]|uniref:hypothetical protein n=1 Tax=Paraburkholderia bryophila TaxID=420952 RepID=UPI00234B5698|nr:hypothetical protein [Paraburkholderia bryophila]WCM24469.1 hypothetical protein NDK50_27050 [Paraburkholderia bryophila]